MTGVCGVVCVEQTGAHRLVAPAGGRRRKRVRAQFVDVIPNQRDGIDPGESRIVAVLATTTGGGSPPGRRRRRRASLAICSSSSSTASSTGIGGG